MKKNLFAVAMALTLGAGAFSACSSEDIQTNQQVGKATSTMSVELAMPMNGTRTVDDDYNKIGEWAGKDQIKSLEVYVFDAAGTLEVSQTFAVGQFSVTQSNGIPGIGNENKAIIRPLEAIKVAAGQKKVYVVVNPTAATTAFLSGVTNEAAFATKYADVLMATETNFTAAPGAGVVVKNNADEIAQTVAADGSTPGTDKDYIVMTAVKAGEVNVADNVTANQTLTTDVNRAKLDVTRSVARVMVTSDKASYTIKGDNPTTVDLENDYDIATITDIKYVVAQGERGLYFQVKSDFSTPAYSYVTTYSSDVVTPAAGEALTKYDYRGLWKQQVTSGISGLSVPTTSLYNTLDATNLTNITNSLQAGLSGEFILPNVHKYGADAASTEYRKGNTAYILIRALMTPAHVYMQNGSVVTGTDYFGGTPKDYVMGANGRFYENNEAAHDDTKNGVPAQKTQLFKAGKVLYFAWVNPDNVTGRESTTGTGWLNSPVVRNNVYHVEISGFLRVGSNWNPLVPPVPLEPTDPSYDPANPNKPNPNQPNNPDPKPTPEENPFEPITPPVKPEDPLTVPETWMSVQTTILPWKVHSYKTPLTF